MIDIDAGGPTRSERIVMRVEPAFKTKVEIAAKNRDGGNISHFIRRAVDRLIESEQPLTPQTQERAS